MRFTTGTNKGPCKRIYNNKTRRMNKPTHTHLQRRNGGGGYRITDMPQRFDFLRVLMNNCGLYNNLRFGNSTRWPGPSLSFSTCMTTTAEHKQGFLNELTYRKHRMYKTIQGPGGSNMHANHMICTQGTLQLSQRRHNSQRNYPHTDNTDWRSRDLTT